MKIGVHTPWKRVLFFVLCSFLFSAIPVFSAENGSLFSIALEQGRIYPGESFEVTLSAHDCGLESPVAGFQFVVSYNPEQVSLSKITISEQISSDSLQTFERDGEIRGVYVCSGNAPIILSGKCVSLTFTTSENLSAETLPLEVKIFDIITWNETALPQEYEAVLSVVLETPPSHQAKLHSLTPSAGTLVPDFSPDVYTYNLTVPATVSRVTFQAAAQENGSVRASRETLGAVGSTTEITLSVTSEDGQSKAEYTIFVLRSEEPESNSPASLKSLSPSEGQLSPAFSADHYFYEMTVGYRVSYLYFDAQAEQGGSVSVNRRTLSSPGNTTEFEITVTSADGENKTSYFVLVYRQEEPEDDDEKSSLAMLERLIPVQGELSPPFSSEILDYTMEVPYEIEQMQFHTRAAENGSVSVDRSSLGGAGSLTMFTITVTSEDKSQKEIYTVTVRREEKPEEDHGSQTAKLSALTSSAGTLTPSFSPDIYEYEMTVPSDISQVEFSASAQENGTVKINRKTLGKMGSTTDFIITVTSESGDEKGTYLIAVTREEEPEKSAESKETSAASSNSQKGQSGGSSSGKKTDSSSSEEYEPAPVQETIATSADVLTLKSSDGTASLIMEDGVISEFLIGILAAILLMLLGCVGGMIFALIILLKRRPPS